MPVGHISCLLLTFTCPFITYCVWLGQFLGIQYPIVLPQLVLPIDLCGLIVLITSMRAFVDDSYTQYRLDQLLLMVSVDRDLCLLTQLPGVPDILVPCGSLRLQPPASYYYYPYYLLTLFLPYCIT